MRMRNRVERRLKVSGALRLPHTRERAYRLRYARRITSIDQGVLEYLRRILVGPEGFESNKVQVRD